MEEPQGAGTLLNMQSVISEDEGFTWDVITSCLLCRGESWAMTTVKDGKDGDEDDSLMCGASLRERWPIK